ncbi:histone chaperone RTT106 [Drosophila subpulchrella]|uniref:histone chaperone RTT106 n=1 Tax=Drosophila subpulchrella TaxID=1486046 RepID=UPI0018A17C3D|nr:histone chaperone RTT106 [Drosophila subpulchrella]
MVRPIYLALVALFVLTCSVSAAPLGESEIHDSSELSVSKLETEVQDSSAGSSEDEEETEAQKVEEETNEDNDDEEDDDDDDDSSLIRRRRGAETTEEPSEEETVTEIPTENHKVDTTTGAAPTRKPVLVLIRDALKKVTTDLPTAQVANNALQYFQQFEHFIQQAIEEVIGDDDDEEETPATVIPETETTVEDIKKPEVENAPEKVPEVEVPAEVPEKETQAVEPIKMEESTSSTSAPLGNAV